MKEKDKKYNAKRKLRIKTDVRWFLTHKYTLMKARVQGKHPISRMYHGLPICEKNVFVQWSLGQKAFFVLWFEWVKGGHPKSLQPVCDRIVSAKGYALGNLQWVTSFYNIRKMTLTERSRPRPTSGLYGVYKVGNSWKASCRKVHLGFFKTKEEAALVYDQMARKNFGELALLNYPEKLL